jgi:hypothetical protein
MAATIVAMVAAGGAVGTWPPGVIVAGAGFVLFGVPASLVDVVEHRIRAVDDLNGPVLVAQEGHGRQVVVGFAEADPVGVLEAAVPAARVEPLFDVSWSSVECAYEVRSVCAVVERPDDHRDLRRSPARSCDVQRKELVGCDRALLRVDVTDPPPGNLSNDHEASEAEAQRQRLRQAMDDDPAKKQESVMRQAMDGDPDDAFTKALRSRYNDLEAQRAELAAKLSGVDEATTSRPRLPTGRCWMGCHTSQSTWPCDTDDHLARRPGQRGRGHSREDQRSDEPASNARPECRGDLWGCGTCPRRGSRSNLTDSKVP